MAPPFTQARRGRVYVRDGTFIMRDAENHVEELAETYDQLPQFLPREIWPRDPDEGEEERPQGTYPFPRDWDGYHPQLLNDLRLNVRNRVVEGYGSLEPMPTFLRPASPEAQAFSGGDSIYKVDRNHDGVIWPHHVAAVHGILYDAIPNNRALQTFEMSALIAIVTYGMGDAVTWLPGAWRLCGSSPGNDNPVIEQPLNNIGAQNNADGHLLAQDPEQTSQNVFFSQFVPEFGIEMKDSVRYTPNFHDDGTGPFNRLDVNWRWYRNRIKGHRWLVVPITQEHGGWSMTIFDRLHAQLYIFDPSATAREERTDAIVHAWINFWNNLGLLGHFTYFVPEVYVPSEGRDTTGLLSIHWLLLTLRNQVGPHMQQTDSSIVTRDIIIQPWIDRHNDPPLHLYRQRLMMHTSSIPLPNWAPLFVENLSKAEAEVKRVVQIILCNELGLFNHPVMEAAPHRTRGMNQVHSADGRLRPEEIEGHQEDDPEDEETFIGNPFHYHDNWVTEDNPDQPQFFTAYGGPQFALPRHLKVRELRLGDPNALPRVHAPNFDGAQRWFYLRNREPPLPPANGNLIIPPGMMQVFTTENPLAREILQTEFRPSAMQRLADDNGDDLIHNTVLELEGRFFRHHARFQAATQGLLHNVFDDGVMHWWPAPRIRGTVRGLGLQLQNGTWVYGVAVGATDVDNPGVGEGPVGNVVEEHYFPVPGGLGIQPPLSSQDSDEMDVDGEGDSGSDDDDSDDDDEDRDVASRYMRVRRPGA